MANYSYRQPKKPYRTEPFDYTKPVGLTAKPIPRKEAPVKKEDLGNRKTFYPVTKEWQREKARKLKIPVLKSFPYGHQKVFFDKSSPKETVSVKPDGNCFFRAISAIITGSEEDHLKVREAITKHISDHPDMYRTFLQSRGGMNEYLTSMRRPREWATDVELLATATFLRTIVEVYFPCRMVHGVTEYSWQTFKPLDNPDITYPAIYICNKNEHFDPVLDVDPEQSNPARIRKHNGLQF